MQKVNCDTNQNCLDLAHLLKHVSCLKALQSCHLISVQRTAYYRQQSLKGCLKGGAATHIVKQKLEFGGRVRPLFYITRLLLICKMLFHKSIFNIDLCRDYRISYHVSKMSHLHRFIIDLFHSQKLCKKVTQDFCGKTFSQH